MASFFRLFETPLTRRLKFFDTPPLAGLSWVNHLISQEITEFR
jgi:hypothetical protein